jgi:hypothetical protein
LKDAARYLKDFTSNNQKSKKMNLQKLTKPLTPSEIEWRVQRIKNGKTTVVPYITNRAVIKRFNEQFGVFGWQSSVIQIQPIKTETYHGTKYVNKEYVPTNITEMEGGFIASISVKDPETKLWVTKEDISDNTDIEALKGGVSGAYKRAAVHWGLGIELYDYPTVFIEGEHRYIPDWAKDRLNGMVDAITNKGFKRDFVVFKN